MKRGFSLIELLVVIAGSSVVFTVLAVSLYTLGRAQTAVQDEKHTAAALHDFARSLRDDAHSAAEVRLTEAPDLRFDGEREVVYDFLPEKSAVRRRVMQGEQTTARESYILPRGSRVEWDVTGEGVVRVVALVSRPAGAKGSQSWRTNRIEAAVGLNRIELP